MPLPDQNRIQGFNRVQGLINTYRANPHLFNDDQLDELEELAKQSGINFKPIRQEFALRKVVEQASSGFLEGLTTIPVGDKPRTTYESIAHSLGHLVGFAPGMLAGPLTLGAKGAAKLGAKALGKGIERGATLASRNISVPMLFGDWVKKGAETGLKKARLDTFDFMKKGSAVRDIAMQSIHLGGAMAMSNIWRGPDAWMEGAVGGGVMGGMFGGLGNFRAIGNLLKSKNVVHHKRAEQIIKSGVAATALGGPAYMRGEPIEQILYETILGGYFGYKGRPAIEAEGGRFIQNLAFYPKRNVIFMPERHPEFVDYSKGAQEYIINSATEQSKTYFDIHYPDIPIKDFQNEFRKIARNDLGREPTQEEVDTIMRQEANQAYYTNVEWVTSPFETPNRNLDPSYEQREDATHSSEKAPETTNLELQKKRYKDGDVFVIEADGKYYNVRRVNGEYEGTRETESRVDRPSDNFQGTEFTEITNIYIPPVEGGNYWKKFKPFQAKLDVKSGDLVPQLSPQDWWRLDNSLDRQGKYIYGGVKDKGIANVRDLHIDANLYTVEELIKNLNITKEDYNNSLQLEAEWYGKTTEQVKEMHDRKWKSNILSEAEEQGFYLKGSGDLSKIRNITTDEIGAKNVTDWNKRQQLFHDKGLPLPGDTFAGQGLSYVVLNDAIDKKPGSKDSYIVRDAETGEIVTKYNESDSDGTILFTPERFDAIMEKIGLPVDNVGMNKPVIMYKLPGGGILMVKAAGSVADGPMLDMMRKNGIDMVIFNSAAKQKGTIQSKDYKYENNEYDIIDFDPQKDLLQLDPRAIRMNLGTFENPETMYGTNFVKQFFGNLNEAQNPDVLLDAYNTYYKKTYDGTPEAQKAILDYFNSKDKNRFDLVKDLDIDDMPIEWIHRILANQYNTKLGLEIRKQIFKLDKEGGLKEIDRFTQEEYRDYLARNDRIMNLTEASESAVKLFKVTRKYADKVYKKYMIKRLISPKYKYSAKSWLSPVLPHHNIEEGTFKAGPDFNPDVIVNGKEMKLKKLWSLYEKNPKKYQSALDFAVIRVPSDSVSGTRVLRFAGFEGKKGTSIYTRNTDNTYLGGADKDSDTVFLYQGLDKKLLKSIKDKSKEWERDDGTMIESSSEKYDTLLRGERDPRFETKASQFSPAMRMTVARNAYKGQSGLGYAMNAKNTMLSWIDILNKNGGVYKEGDLVIKLKGDGFELRRLAREMVNTSADAANYPNLTDFGKWREALFDTTFEATIGGKKVKFSQVVNKSSLGELHRMQNTFDFKGRDYKNDRAYTLDDFQVALERHSSKMPKDANDIRSLIVRDAFKYGLHTDLKAKYMNMSDYHTILREANARINAKDSDEAKFIRDHLTHLIRVPIGTDLSAKIKAAEKSGNWEQVLDLISADTFMVASNNAMARKALEIYREFKENGINDPTGIMDGILKKIAQHATMLKTKYESIDPTDTTAKDTKFKDYDAEIQAFKVELAKTSATNEIPYKSLAEYFDLWMISPYNHGTYITRKGGTSRLPMQSQEISNEAWEQVMFEYENIYRSINQRIEGKPITEPALFELPKDWNNPASKQDQAKIVTDKIVDNIIEQSSIKKQASGKDREFKRKALTEEDLKDIEMFEYNMQRGPGVHIDEFIGSFTLRYFGNAKTISDLTIVDIKAMNKHFKDYDRRFGGEDIPNWIYWADPRYVDEYMWMREHTMYKTGYSVTSAKGEKIPIYRSLGTLGTIRNWFRQTDRQMNVHTDAVPDINNLKYEFRIELTPNESDAIMLGIINKAEGTNLKIDKKYTDKKYTIKKKEYTFQEAVDKYHEVLKNDMKEFGDKWLYAKSKEGEHINFREIDEITDWNSSVAEKINRKLNEYLRYKSDGSLDVEHFLKQFVVKGDKGDLVPNIPLENIYRFQYEYNLEKQIKGQGLTGKKATEYRINYRKKHKFEGVSEFEAGTYFPHLNFGWNKGAEREMTEWIIGKGNEAYDAAIKNPDISEKEALIIRDAKITQLKMRIDAATEDAGGMDKHAIDEMLSKINYKELTPEEIATHLENLGFNTRPENLLQRSQDMPGYDKRASVIDSYKEKVIRANYRNLGSIMANYRIDTFIEKNPMGDFTPKQFKKFNPDPKNPLYENWTEVWADYLKFYLRDAFGHSTTFPERVIESMKHGDPLKLKKTIYMTLSDQKVIKGIEKIDKQFKKLGMTTPFLSKLPQITAEKGTKEYDKQVEARKQYLSKVIHDFGRLEARFELLTLLANTGTLTANMFGGSSMTIASAGLRNFVRVNRFNWLKKNVLFDQEGNPTLTYVNNEGKDVTVKTKEDLYKWIQDKGVIDNFISDELNTNLRLKAAMKKSGRAGIDFIRDLRKLLKENPDARDETVIELARRYGVQDTMLKFGGAFMQVSERKLRRDSFLAHALQAKDRLGQAGKNMNLNDPYLVDAGLQGIEATQFLYHSAFRPAFMRTSFGKVMTRFKLFAFQSIRTRKELLRRADYYGYKEGTPDYENMKNLFMIDMLTFALGSAYSYSLFDTALPPPYDYLQETSELLFGDKAQREKAFFGTYPRAIAPLQIVTPPSARVLINPIKSLINNDWDRFLDYHIHTMYPFGRIVRQFDKTFYDPQSGRFEMINEQYYGTTFGRFMQQFFRLPTDKVVSKYNRAQLEEKRKQIISETLGI